MKPSKINTIPCGSLIILVLFLEMSLCFLLAMFLLPNLESIGLFSFALIFLIAIIYYISKKYLNFIYLTKDHIWHGKEKHTWDTVFVTANFSYLPGARCALVCYLYFDDHYLTEEECKSKEIKKKGFYITAKQKRLELILKLYRKKIKILTESQYTQCQKICDLIKQHNIECVWYELDADWYVYIIISFLRTWKNSSGFCQVRSFSISKMYRQILSLFLTIQVLLW